MSDANIGIVKKGLERFLAGDIPGFIETLAPGIEWDHSGPEGVPFNRVYKGREDMVKFFAAIDEHLEMIKFEPREYFAAGDRVVVLGSFAWKVKATKKSWGSDFAFAFTVRNGQIAHWKPIFDMGAEAAAFRP